MTICRSYVRGKRVRVTRLDECGTPPAPATACSLAVSSGYITVNYTAEYEAGDEHIQKNANGDLCITDRSADIFKRYAVEIEFCEVDPDLFGIVTGNDLEVQDDGQTVGFRVSRNVAASDFALEVWVGVANQDCVSGVTEYGYLLLPHVHNGTVRDISVQNGPITFTVQGWTKDNNWLNGPYEVVLNDGSPAVCTALEDPLEPEDHLLLRRTQCAPPAAACGCQVMPALPTPADSPS